MDFQKSVIKIIETRYSCRSFDSSKEVDEMTLKKLSDCINETNTSQKEARFLLAGRQMMTDAEKLGTYGMISGAGSFIIGIVDKTHHDPLKFGYLFEKIILFATDIGLQTCWLGGTFNRDDFEQKTGLSENEFIPIVSPFGLRKETPRLFDRATRAFIGADDRKPWDQLFFDSDNKTPINPEGLGKYRTVLEMIRLGPSASNKQPWRVVKQGNFYHLFLCRTKNYNRLRFDMQKNDIGIAMCHFELSAREFGLAGKWMELKDVTSFDAWEYIVTWDAEK